MLDDVDLEIEKRLPGSPDEKETESWQLAKSRIGQGVFRERVQAIEPKCRVSGVSDPLFLIASHIRPWKSSSNTQRLDGENGLMLAPNVDKLFDQGYISFTDEGDLLISPTLSGELREQLGLLEEGTNCGSLTAGQQEYLAYHRSVLFKGPDA
jgi:putative restriction endonuclease